MFAAIRGHLAASAPHDAVRAAHHAATAHGEDVSAREAAPPSCSRGLRSSVFVRRSKRWRAVASS